MLSLASTASAETFVFSTPISGDVVTVTLDVVDVPGGDAVDIAVSIAPGEGDLLGVFGNTVTESIVSDMSVDDADGLVTQWQFNANKVWKVGGGNVMSPVKGWDWGIRIAENGSAAGAIESADFRLSGPGLSVAELIGTANQGWVFGIRIQGTSGSEGSSKLGLGEGVPPVGGEPPTIEIASPVAGSLIADVQVVVTGTVTGDAPLAVDVNGVAATVAGGSFTATVPLVEGPNDLVALATNADGSDSATVGVVRDTTGPSIVVLTPADGAATVEANVEVQAQVDDPSGVSAVLVAGLPATLQSGVWVATVPLASGDNAVTVEATDALGNASTTSVGVRRLAPPELTSTPPLSVAERGVYGYAAIATDPDPGDVLAFGLETSPPGMSVDAASGLVTWAPGAMDIGAHPVTLRVTDSAGLFDEQTFTLTVLNVEDPPSIISSPGVVVDERTAWAYDVDATDPDAGDTLIFSLVASPAAMTIDPVSGLVFWSPVTADVGAHPVTVRATDATGLFDEQSFTLTVVDVPEPPVIGSTPVSTVDERAPYVYEVDASDPDLGETLSFSLETAPGGMSVDAITGVVTWAPTASDIGTHPVTVRVTDSTGRFEDQSFTLTVRNVNDAPTIVSSPVVSVDERDSYTYAVSASDPDAGDTLVLSLVAGPLGMVIDAASGVVTWTPGDLDLGDHEVTVRVTDAGGLFVEQSFTVTVVNLNDPPQIFSTPLLSVNELALWTYGVQASDPDPGDSFVLELSSGPEGLAFDAPTGVAMWTPTRAQLGAHEVTFRVTDAGGLFDEQSFSLTVLDVNDPPTVTSTPVTSIDERAPYTYDVEASDLDVGDTLVFSLVTAPASMTIDPVTGLITWSPTADDVGDHAVIVRITDAGDLFEEQSFTLTVANVPDPPAFSTMPVTSVDERATWIYDADASDPDAGDTLLFSLVAAPAASTIDSASGLASWTPTASDIGDHLVTLRVTDAAGLFDEQTFTLTVSNVNDAPTITSIPPITVDEGAGWAYDVLAEDPDAGDVLTLSLQLGPPGMFVDAANGLVAWTPTVDDVGDHDVTVRVTDSGGLFDDQSFTLTVRDVNEAPVITSAPVTAVEAGSAYVATVTADDPDVGDVVTFSIVAGPAGLAIGAGSGVLSWSPGDGDVGDHSVTVRASDPGGLYDEQSFTLTVEPRPLPPVFTSTPRTLTAPDVDYAYVIVATDPNPGDTVSLALTSGPAAMTLDPAGPALVWTPGVAEVGSYPVVVTATDSTGLSSTQSFDLVVAFPPQAAFTVRKGRNFALAADGAQVVDYSSVVNTTPCYQPGNIIDESTTCTWRTLGVADEFVTIDLAGDDSVVVDHVELKTVNSATAPRNIEIRVSTTGQAPSDFVTVAAATLPQTNDFQTIELPPGTAARYLQLYILDNHGASRTDVYALRAASRSRSGGVVSLGAGGASIAEVSSETGGAAERIIDFPTYDSSLSTYWRAATCTDSEYLTIELSPDRPVIVNRAHYFRGNSSAIADEFQLLVSTDGLAPEDFTPILDAVVEGTVLGERVYHFDDTLARYVKLVPQHCPNATFGATVFDLQIISPQVGGLEVAFDDLSSSDVGEVVAWRWFFGDGGASTERDPMHTYREAGTYLVTLTVTDEHGLRATTSMEYMASGPADVDFSYTPTAPNEAQSVAFTDASQPGEASQDGAAAAIAGRAWNFLGVATRTTALSANQAFGDDGTYPVSLTVYDGQLLETTVVRDVEIRNLPPTATVTVDEAVLWGQPWSIISLDNTDPGRIYFNDVPADRSMTCSIDYGDGTPVVPQTGTYCTGNFFAAEEHEFDLPGDYEIVFTFTDKDGASIERRALVTAMKRETAVVLYGTADVAADGTATVKAKLIDRYENGRLLEGRSIRFEIDGIAQTAFTDANGDATVTLPFASGASNVVSVSFDGDPLYSRSAGSVAFLPGVFPGIVRTGPPPGPDSRGNEYVVGFQTNYTGSTGSNWLFLSSDTHTFARVEVPGLGIDTQVEIPARQVGRLELPPAVRTSTLGAIEPKGIRVTAPTEITLHALNFVPFSTDAYLGIPKAQLGTEYYVVSYESKTAPLSGGTPGGFSVIATEDGTTVTITTTTDMQVGPDTPSSLPAGTTFTVTLDALEQLELRGVTNIADPDPTGSHIVADKNVAVYGMNYCTNVPADVNYCDHLVEMLPPVDTWGSHFLVAPFEGRSSGYFLRMVAAHDGTNVTVNGAPVVTLAAGDWYEVDVAAQEYMLVESSQPMLLAQYAKGGLSDLTRRDPFLMLVVPTPQFGSDYLVSTVPAEVRDYADRLTVIAPTAEVGGIRVNGSPVSETWTPIPGSDHSAALIVVPSGANRVEHVSRTVPFAVYAYGWFSDDSYGYPGAMRLLPLAGGCVPSTSVGGDGLDNDCDGRVDEENADGLDDDGDGLVDEDLTFAGSVAINIAPVAYDRSTSVREESSRQLVLSGFDANADPLTYEIVTPPAHGTLSGAGNVRTYTPEADYVGPDQLTYRVSDGALYSVAAVYEIDVFPLNDFPDIFSTPVTYATEGEPYFYDVMVLDRDGDTEFTYSLPEAPAGMAISPIGMVSWVPGDAQTGLQDVTVRVTDAGGAFSEQSYTIDVTNVNDAPAIVSAPPRREVILDTQLDHAVQAVDPDAGDTLTFALDAGPVGMQIDPVTGVLTWAPTTGDEGTYTVQVSVYDAFGSSDSQGFEVEAAIDVAPPIVLVAAEPAFVAPGESTTLSVLAIDEVAIAQVNLTVNGTPLTLDANGQALYTPTGPGIYTAVGSAVDLAGNLSTDETLFAVTDPSDIDPPDVDLISPVMDSVHTMPAQVVGSVDDANLLLWQVRIGRMDDAESEWRTIADGDTPVASGVLGTFDPTLLENGMWRIVLEAEDVNGAITRDEIVVRVDGQAKVGVVQLSFVDMVVDTVGVPIAVTRRYDSRDKTQGDFGYGWTLSISEGSVESNVEPGYGWVIATSTEPFAFACQIVAEQLAHTTEVRLSDREYYLFRPTLVNTFPFSGGCRADVVFELVDGTTAGATLDILGPVGVRAPGHLVSGDGPVDLPPGQLLDELTNLPFDPRQFRLSTADGRTFDIDRGRGITRLEGPNGNAVSILRNGLVHSDGRSVAFVRDAEGRIERIVDSEANQVAYEYDARGDLVGVTNQIAELTQFEYITGIPHHLARIIGPDGLPIAALDYDADGRMVESCDAESNCTEVVHDVAGQRETQIDPTNRAVVYEYDARGNVTSMTDGLNHTTIIEYDARDNVTRFEDPTGAVTTFTYDDNGNRLSKVEPYEAGEDPADYTTTYAYNARNQLTSLTLPTGATVHRDYDANGNETAIRDDQGNTILGFTYDAQGNVLSETDRFGTSTYQYDGRGDPVQSIDPLGQVTTMAYDDLGNLTSMTDDGVVSSFQYDALGRETTSDYGLGITSANEYEPGAPDWTAVTGPTLGRIERKFTAAGRLGGWVGPDDAEVTFLYDQAGRLREQIEPDGRRTQTTYDAAGRPESVTDLATGATTTTVRDAAGRPLTVTDPLTNPTSFTYRPDGKLKSRTNARSHTWSFDYTPTSASVTDPLTRTTTTTRTPLGLPIRTDYADGTSIRVEYDGTTALDEAEDYPTKIWDEKDRLRSLSYDGYSRLTSATDLAGQAWSYAYDGDELRSVESPEGETLTFVYDALGDRQDTLYPDGGVRGVTYDAARNIDSVTLAHGTVLSFTHDTAGREKTRTSSIGESRSIDYGVSGEITQTTDATGTTTYHYDVAGRFAGLTYPSGASVRYERDLLGRVERVLSYPDATSAALVTEYGYDGVSNITSIVDPSGNTTEMDYDEVDRLIERRLPNGVTTTWTYDLRDRPLSITHTNAGGTVLASVTYERDLSGEPRKITREDGSYVELDYDAAWRIEAERYHDPSGTLLETITYAYDLDGNRTTRATNAGLETNTYSAGYRLDATIGANPASFGYDGSGRVTSLSRNATTLGLSYDSDDLVTQATSSSTGETASYAYDAMGRRTRTVDAQGAREVLVAPTLGEGLDSPQLVVDETTGAWQAAFVYAGEYPLMRITPSGPVYYLHDGMGSVIGLADGSGSEVAEFRYDAFGIERSATGSQAALPSSLGGDFRYHGQWQERATGLYFVRARVYDAGSGRFLSRDSVEGVFERPESFHPYTWNANNPEVYRDPTGRFSLTSFSVGQGIQQDLRNLSRQALIGHFRDELRDRAQGVAGDLLLSFFRTLLPADPGAFGAFTETFNDVGDAFEGLIASEVCNGLGVPQVIQENTRLFVNLSSSGKPTSSGLSCREFNFQPSFRPGSRDNEVDIVFSPIRLVGTSEPSVSRGDQKAYLPVELKFNALRFSGNPDQLAAISEFSAKYVGGRIALLVSVKVPKAARGRLERRLKEEMLENGVVMFLVGLLD